MAEENEFVQKCLETRENKQNVVLNESSEALGNHSEIVRILVLAMMAWAEVILSDKLLLVFRCFTNKMVLFGFAIKAKQLILVSKIILTDPYVPSGDLYGRKPYKFGVQVSSSCLCSMRALGSTQRNRFMQTSLSKVCSMYWQKYKSQIVGLCSFNNF